jgi:hypothetical protein
VADVSGRRPHNHCSSNAGVKVSADDTSDFTEGDADFWIQFHCGLGMYGFNSAEIL